MSSFRAIIEDAAKRGDLQPSLSLLTQIWGAIVGPEIANNTRPCGWNKGELTLEVNPSWLKHMQGTSNLLTRKLNLRLPFEVTSVTLIEGHIESNLTPKAELVPPTPTETDRDLVDDLPEELQDAAAQIAAFVRQNSGE